MINLLTGFTYCGYCNCTGVRNNKYSKGEYVVYIIPKRRLFHVKKSGNYLIKNQPLSTLCQQLKYLGINDSEDCLNQS